MVLEVKPVKFAVARYSSVGIPRDMYIYLDPRSKAVLRWPLPNHLTAQNIHPKNGKDEDHEQDKDHQRYDGAHDISEDLELLHNLGEIPHKLDKTY